MIDGLQFLCVGSVTLSFCGFSHGAQVLRGGALEPSPSAAVQVTRCLPQADFTGLTVCREVRAAGRLGFTAPVRYHVTAENTDP